MPSEKESKRGEVSGRQRICKRQNKSTRIQAGSSGGVRGWDKRMDWLHHGDNPGVWDLSYVGCGAMDAMSRHALDSIDIAINGCGGQ